MHCDWLQMMWYNGVLLKEVAAFPMCPLVEVSLYPCQRIATASCIFLAKIYWHIETFQHFAKDQVLVRGFTVEPL